MHTTWKGRSRPSYLLGPKLVVTVTAVTIALKVTNLVMFLEGIAKMSIKQLIVYLLNGYLGDGTVACFFDIRILYAIWKYVEL